jgi:hypothetical protein
VKSETKARLKEKALEELKLYLISAAYLFLFFGAFMCTAD